MHFGSHIASLRIAPEPSLPFPFSSAGALAPRRGLEQAAPLGALRRLDELLRLPPVKRKMMIPPDEEIEIEREREIAGEMARNAA
jgi:hypothetical protein